MTSPLSPPRASGRVRVSDLVPGTSRQTVLLLYDLLHFCCLHGARQRRAVVVDYLVRAGMCAAETLTASRLRAFERIKLHLAALGVRYRYETEPTGAVCETFFVVERPQEAKARLAELLDRTIPKTEGRPAAVRASA